jgi:chromatin structure-remodeling complex subunit RSC3/30
MHQEGDQSQIPFFLSELRRRSFANSFSSDKALSTFFGRPPRIAMRYCSCLPPYDLTDEEMIAPLEIRNRALAKLDPLGWNTDGKINRQTMARVKLLINVIREESLELSLGPPASDPEQRQKAL